MGIYSANPLDLNGFITTGGYPDIPTEMSETPRELLDANGILRRGLAAITCAAAGSYGAFTVNPPQKKLMGSDSNPFGTKDQKKQNKNQKSLQKSQQ